MDTDFNLVKRVTFDDYVPKYEWRNPDEHKPSYEMGYLGKRYLYLLFMGCTYNEMKAKDDKGSYLEVFDFDGNPIARYELQGGRPRYFAVDEETFTLYSPMKGFPEDHLMMYKLEGLK